MKITSSCCSRPDKLDKIIFKRIEIDGYAQAINENYNLEIIMFSLFHFNRATLDGIHDKLLASLYK